MDAGLGVSSSQTTFAPSAFTVSTVSVMSFAVPKPFVCDDMITRAGRRVDNCAMAAARHCVQLVDPTSEAGTAALTS